MSRILFTPKDANMMLADALTVLQTYDQDVIWLQRITEDMPGATEITGSWDIRQQMDNLSDGSFGVGLQLTDAANVTHLGWLPGVSITIAIAETPTSTTREIGGITEYTENVAIVQPPTVLAKGDILVMGARRFVVADNVDPLQAYSVMLWQVVTIEERAADNWVFLVSTT